MACVARGLKLSYSIRGLKFTLGSVTSERWALFRRLVGWGPVALTGGESIGPPAARRSPLTSLGQLTRLVWILSGVAGGDWPGDRHGNPSAGCPPARGRWSASPRRTIGRDRLTPPRG